MQRSKASRDRPISLFVALILPSLAPIVIGICEFKHDKDVMLAKGNGKYQSICGAVLVLKICCLGVALFISRAATAYPEFIGYGYSTCITCHYNGNGGGPLSDYGRALWSSEIASRALFPSNVTDERLAAASGFLGPVELPVWFRPHIKYRGLAYRMNPGSASTDSSHYYHMQADAGFTLQDSMSKYLATITWGRMVAPSEANLDTGLTRFLAREYYARVEFVKTWWIYAGLIEKVFGIRNIDHTSYQRTYQGFNVVNDDPNGVGESQGVILQKVEDKWEVSANYFFGNPYDDPIYRQRGFSMTSEFEIGENKRLGASIFSASSDVLKKQMAAVHYRQQIAKGSALMAEWGLIQDQVPSASQSIGSYSLLQGLVSLSRGYNLKTTIERYNQTFSPNSPDQWKWSFGFLMFPLPRFEFRAEVVNFRQFTSQGSSDDSWALEGQVHVSL
jgi:hypothetical protein